MTCDVIEVTTRRGKREEVFVGLYESGRGHGREEQGEEEEEEKRGSCWQATSTSPRGWGEEVKQTGHRSSSAGVSGHPNCHSAACCCRSRGGSDVTSFAPFLPPSAPHEHGANVSARWAGPVLPPQMVTVVLLVGTFPGNLKHKMFLKMTN